MDIFHIYSFTYADRTALNYKLLYFPKENLISLFQMTKHAHCRVMRLSMMMNKNDWCVIRTVFARAITFLAPKLSI